MTGEGLPYRGRREDGVIRRFVNVAGLCGDPGSTTRREAQRTTHARSYNAQRQIDRYNTLLAASLCLFK
jgi:hypothetical protein